MYCTCSFNFLLSVYSSQLVSDSGLLCNRYFNSIISDIAVVALATLWVLDCRLACYHSHLPHTRAVWCSLAALSSRVCVSSVEACSSDTTSTTALIWRVSLVGLSVVLTFVYIPSTSNSVLCAFARPTTSSSYIVYRVLWCNMHRRNSNRDCQLGYW